MKKYQHLLKGEAQETVNQVSVPPHFCRLCHSQLLLLTESTTCRFEPKGVPKPSTA